MVDSTQAPALNPSQPFDIYKAYQEKLGGLPPGLAAVSALTSALTEHRLTTASEAISLLSSLDKTLKSQLVNPIPASAGTDAFLQSLVTTAARPGAGGFDQALRDLQSASNEFVQRGLQATKDISKHGAKLIRDGFIIVITSVDAAVEGVVESAAQAGVRFKAVFVSSDQPGNKTAALLGRLGELDISTTTIQPHALAQTLSVLAAGPSANLYSSSANTGVIVLGSAAAILSNGGVLAAIGTAQACIVAQALGVRTYIVSETWKVVRLLPLAGEENAYGFSITWQGQDSKLSNGEHRSDTPRASGHEPMDVTPPKYITGIVTESGVHGTAALSEESIKIWF